MVLLMVSWTTFLLKLCPQTRKKIIFFRFFFTPSKYSILENPGYVGTRLRAKPPVSHAHLLLLPPPDPTG